MRSGAQVVLLVLATVLAIVTPPAVWARNLVLDTDRYVSTLQPVGTDPGVQQAVIDTVDRAVMTRLDVVGLVKRELPRAAALGPPLAQAVSNLVDKVVGTFVRSKAFEVLWTAANRAAHIEVVQLLTGSSVRRLQIDPDGRVLLDLGPVVEKVREKLATLGLTVAQNVAPVAATIQIAQLSGLQGARKATRILDDAADWLPWIVLALLAGSVAVAARRRRAVVIAASCTAGAMLAVGLLLLVGRHFYLAAVPADTLPRPVAQHVFDIIVRYLRDGIRVVLVVAALVAAVAWLCGPSRSARATRAVPGRVARSRLAGAATGFLRGHTGAVVITIGALVAAVLVFWPSPSATTVLSLVLVGAALAIVTAVVGRPGSSRI